MHRKGTKKILFQAVKYAFEKIFTNKKNVVNLQLIYKVEEKNLLYLTFPKNTVKTNNS